MKRDDVVTLLKQQESEFRHSGIGALFLFGSVAREEALDTSDVDLFFDLDRPSEHSSPAPAEYRNKCSQGILMPEGTSDKSLLNNPELI